MVLSEKRNIVSLTRLCQHHSHLCSSPTLTSQHTDASYSCKLVAIMTTAQQLIWQTSWPWEGKMHWNWTNMALAQSPWKISTKWTLQLPQSILCFYLTTKRWKTDTRKMLYA